MKNKLKTIAIFCVFFLEFTLAFAQSVKRIEIAGTTNSSDYKVITLGEEGVLLLSKVAKATYNIKKYDADLNEVWSVNGELEENQSYVDFCRDGKDIYFLFSKYNSDLYQIIKVSTGIGLMQKFFFENVRKFEISEFKVFNAHAFLAGTIKEEPVLMSVDLQKMQPRILSGGLKGSATISSLDYDRKNDLLLVSYSVKKGKDSFMAVKKISMSGKIVEQLAVEPEEEYGLITGKLFNVADDSQLMIGNYGFRGYQSNGVPMSQGVYMSKIEGEQAAFVKMHSFTDFKNFFNFLPPKQLEKMRKKIEKKKLKGNELKLNYRVLVHDIIKKDNQYILVAEVFYPEFRNMNMYGNPYYGYGSMFGSPFGYAYNPIYAMRYARFYYGGLNSWAWNPWMYSNYYGSGNQQFDGFRFRHAIVAGFDASGELLWDNSFSFDNFKSMDLKEKVKVKLEDDKILLVYSNKGSLKSKVIQGNEVKEGEKTIKIDTSNESDRIKDTETDDIEFWYNDYFLAWGYQKISNRAEGGRNVFYLNKISF